MIKVHSKENSLTTVCDVLLTQNNSLASDILQIPAQVLNKLMMWHQRAATRAHLRNLEPQFLQDVGLSPKEAHKEARKPFWI
tara:strand:- start:131 stop:376 length:246 start_codon:yes stop_codon:yes gene_type:complete